MPGVDSDPIAALARCVGQRGPRSATSAGRAPTRLSPAARPRAKVPARRRPPTSSGDQCGWIDDANDKWCRRPLAVSASVRGASGALTASATRGHSSKSANRRGRCRTGRHASRPPDKSAKRTEPVGAHCLSSRPVFEGRPAPETHRASVCREPAGTEPARTRRAEVPKRYDRGERAEAPKRYRRAGLCRERRRAGDATELARARKADVFPGAVPESACAGKPAHPWASAKRPSSVERHAHA